MQSASIHPMRPTTSETGVDLNSLTKLGALAEASGRSIVDLAGFLDRIDHDADVQLDQVDSVLGQSQDLARITQDMTGGLKTVAEANAQALETVEGSMDAMKSSAENSREVAGWVGQLDTMLSSVQETLDSVNKANGRIAEIAKQVNILAVNARIEAARAGTLGQGFAVVAEAINTLSHETSQAANAVTGSTADLCTLVQGLRGEAKTMAESAKTVIDGAALADRALGQISDNVTAANEGTGILSREATAVASAVETLTPTFQTLADGLKSTAKGVAQARQQAERIVDTSEQSVQVAVALGAVSADGPLIEIAQDRAAQIARLFEEAVRTGKITTQALFSDRYDPIPGTNPQQVIAPFTKLTDALLPAIQEPTQASDPRIVFCVAIDRNGYLPTHNAQFSKPQGADPVWNTANSRNRRIFDDRVGLKAGRNSAPFLVQTYRRDMGGGNFVLMKDISAPVHVLGRHWGGFRMGVKPSN